jgi:putative transposase
LETCPHEGRTVFDHFSRRRLPHWDRADAPFFVTTCLDGSIPALGLLDLERYREQLDREPKPADQSEAEWRVVRWKKTFARRERWLDSTPGCAHLERPGLAGEVVSALKHFHGLRYRLIAWVVMPSHYHWVFEPLTSWGETVDVSERSARERITHSINRHTARRCNELLGREGQFWQHESYDHWVRDEDELERIIVYIHMNPVVAGLVDSPEKYPFSSAHHEASL